MSATDSDRLLLITGATGQQGGAVVRALLASGQRWRLRALMRNPASDAARSLGWRGVEVVKGDLDDEAAVRRAVDGAHGVFSVQTPMGHGTEAEERQGKLLATAAADAKVAHFVFSSVGGADRQSGVPHFESKWRIEQHIAALGLPATIIRPVAFMDNFRTAASRTFMLSMLRSTAPKHRHLQLVAVRDIGRLAAQAFATPERSIGRAMELAGDSVTVPQAVRILRRAGMRPALALPLPERVRNRLPRDLTLMFDWFARTGYQADIPALRRELPDLHTFAQWAMSQR